MSEMCAADLPVCMPWHFGRIFDRTFRSLASTTTVLASVSLMPYEAPSSPQGPKRHVWSCQIVRSPPVQLPTLLPSLVWHRLSRPAVALTLHNRSANSRNRLYQLITDLEAQHTSSQCRQFLCVCPCPAHPLCSSVLCSPPFLQGYREKANSNRQFGHERWREVLPEQNCFTTTQHGTEPPSHTPGPACFIDLPSRNTRRCPALACLAVELPRRISADHPVALGFGVDYYAGFGLDA